VGVAKPFDAFSADFDPGLAKQLVGEQAAAHADLAMDAPDRQLDALCVERLLPGKDVLIDAVNEGAVEIKQEDRLNIFRSGPSLPPTRTACPASPTRLSGGCVTPPRPCYATSALPRLTVWRTSKPSNCGCSR
jgi:hypothetical protein